MRTTTRPMPSPFRYDLKLWIASRGRERHFRARLVDLARIAPGDAVLDVGCGTGTLAIAAAKQTGRDGTVDGVDPSIKLLARAQKKARRSGVEVTLHTGSGDRLPFDDTSFDVALCTLVLHHLPASVVHATFAEIHRVLRPGGRLLVVDIGGRQDGTRTMHGSHLLFDLDTLVPQLPHVGFTALETGPIESQMPSLESLRYFLAEAA